MRFANFAPLMFIFAIAVVCLSACKNESTASATPATSPTIAKFHLSASIQELMHDLVDPSADAVWDAVGTTITSKGIEDRQPRTEAEWRQAKAHAVLLIEATNLLVMDGRRLVPAGGKVLDEGNEGVLTAEAGQKRLDAQHDTFVQFARALRDTGEKMLAAIEAKNPQAMLEIGAEMDSVCESCHTTFWYPNQVYPSVKNGITTLEATRAGTR
jgi:hypothetical protein